MKAKLLSPSAENLATAADALRRGEVVAIPTETVYGLAGAAFQAEALARIFEAKERPTFDPLIVHVGLAHASGRRIEDLERARLVDGKDLRERARERAHRLMHAFWPGPLTLVLPKHADVPDLATSGLSTVAIRMPRHPVAQALIAAAGTPLAAPSANRFGRISPTTAEAVFQELGDRIGWIVDGGASEIGLESTVLSLDSNGEARLLRPGGVAREEIEERLGISLKDTGASPASGPQSSPGMLESHYAPSKKLRLLPRSFEKMSDNELRTLAPAPVGVLLQSGNAREAERKLPHGSIVSVLSERGDGVEAARKLFMELRRLDSSAAKSLWAELPAAETGLFHAIADRLRRAAARG